jgi:hypothetical protein
VEVKEFSSGFSRGAVIFGMVQLSRQKKSSKLAMSNWHNERNCSPNVGTPEEMGDETEVDTGGFQSRVPLTR